MCLLYLFQSSSTPRPGASGTAIFPFLIPADFWSGDNRPPAKSSGYRYGRITRCRRAHMGKHRQRDIEWLLEWQPQVSPQSSQSCATGLHRKASRSADRQVEYLPHWHHRMTHFAPVGGDHVSRDGQPVARRNSAITSRPEKPCSARMDLRHR